MPNFNTILFELVHQGAGQWEVLDRFFVALTSYVSYGIIALVFLYLFLVRPLRTHEAKARLQRFGAAAQATVALFFTWIIVWAIKVIVAHPRPFIALADIEPLIHAEPFQSFPSAHAAFTMAIAIAVLPYHRHLGHLLIAFSCVVALSRLYVGVHYPLDIIAGLFLGYLIPTLVHKAFRK